jgi:hypothetical protein
MNGLFKKLLNNQLALTLKLLAVGAIQNRSFCKFYSKFRCCLSLWRIKGKSPDFIFYKFIEFPKWIFIGIVSTIIYYDDARNYSPRNTSMKF